MAFPRPSRIAPNWCIWSDCDVSAIADFKGTQTVIRLRRHAEPWRAFAGVITGAIFVAQTHISSAQMIFRVTDGDGSVTFSATPTETMRNPATLVAVEGSPRYDTRIETPANDNTIPMGSRNFTVQTALSPRLTPDENLQLLLNGEPVGAPQRIANWQLTNVYRGEHRLQVVRLDESGTQRDTSAASMVHLMRPTVNR